MALRILGLDPKPFLPLYGLSDGELAAHGVIRQRVDEPHGAPDRIELRDAEPGETVLLLNHEYLSADSPYRGRHAIYVREGAVERFDAVGVVPDALRRRLLSLRAFDAAGMMVDADVVDGAALEPLAERLLADSRTAFVHAHHARRGCYAARIERAGTAGRHCDADNRWWR
ncbi:DUF1203 domain-containing protein [Ideonella sp.]|uniref:DUF1203 domain-containing protein n=1 Tax=Ideonella sp. TaxID=1929293 RepID=UPI002B4A3149|nr:DUF1203 domain-containing protein [Ideonella sp.]HJV71920.1 DUF1203 domain-containing protein [Ideonella sp.]